MHALNRWLIAGLVIGLTMAMMGLVDLNAPEATINESAVATVAGQSISRRQYEEALATVGADRRGPLDEATRQHVLDQLINEQLLAQYGRDLELPLRAPRLRDALVDEVLEMIRLEAESEHFSPEQLRAYLQAHPERFRGPELLHVRAWYAPDAATATNARPALEADGASTTLERAIVPDGAVPADTLRDYLGPGVVTAARALDIGEVTAPIAVGDRFVLIQLLGRQAADTPSFEPIEGALRNAMQHDRAEHLLAARLQALRERYGVEVYGDAP